MASGRWNSFRGMLTLRKGVGELFEQSSASSELEAANRHRIPTGGAAFKSDGHVPAGPRAQPVLAPDSRPEREASGPTVSRRFIQNGMEVVGLDARRVGRVKQVRLTDFLVDRPLQRDIYVPVDAVQAVVDERVVLTIRADEVDRRPGLTPRFFGLPW
jgi:hypothetical protein